MEEIYEILVGIICNSLQINMERELTDAEGKFIVKFLDNQKEKILKNINTQPLFILIRRYMEYNGLDKDLKNSLNTVLNDSTVQNNINKLRVEIEKEKKSENNVYQLRIIKKRVDNIELEKIVEALAEIDEDKKFEQIDREIEEIILLRKDIRFLINRDDSINLYKSNDEIKEIKEKTILLEEKYMDLKKNILEKFEEQNQQIEKEIQILQKQNQETNKVKKIIDPKYCELNQEVLGNGYSQEQIEKTLVITKQLSNFQSEAQRNNIRKQIEKFRLNQKQEAYKKNY